MAKRGEEKTERARRVPCIHDTTVARGWIPAQKKMPILPPPPTTPLLLRATLAQCSRARFGIVWPDGFVPLMEFLDIANTHPDQLTLAEFSALRIRRLVQNLDLMAIARTVDMAAKTKKENAEDEDDDGDQPRKPGPGMHSEFMGGEHDVDDEAEIPEEDLGLRAPPQLTKITLDAATSILRRDDEIAAAQKKGRHREADMQMKSFAEKFASTLNASMPRLSYAQADASPKLLGANAKAALAHQTAVRSAMKKDQEDLRSSVDTPAKQEDAVAMLAAMKNLEAEATCVTIPLPESLRGPKHVAEHIMQEQRKLGRILNDEQKMLYALWVDILEDAFQRRPNHEEPWIPPDTWLFDIIVDGLSLIHI